METSKKEKERGMVIKSQTIADGIIKMSSVSSTVTAYSISRYRKREAVEGCMNDGILLREARQKISEPNNINNKSIYFMLNNNFLYVGKSDGQTPISRPIQHLTDNHKHGWDRVLIFLQSGNYADNCNYFETVLYNTAKAVNKDGRIHIDNEEMPAKRYEGIVLNDRIEYSGIFKEIIEYTKHLGYNFFDVISVNKVECLFFCKCIILHSSQISYFMVRLFVVTC